MQVQLIVEDEGKKGQIIPINVPSFIIGRAKGCNLRSPSSHVSRQHCIIQIQNNAVSIRDLGGENGTFVNGQRIIAPQVLTHGDIITIGTHKFRVSLGATQETKAPVVPQESPKPEYESELMFDVRYEGQLVSVTKNKLFELAKKGRIHPDDLVTIAGTKVFADSIEGIVFGDSPPTVPPSAVQIPPAVPAEPTPTYDVWKTEEKPNPFDTAVSKSSAYVPPPQRQSFSVTSPTIETTRDRIDSSEKVDLLTRGKQLLAIILFVGGISAGIWYFYIGRETQPQDIFYVEGTVTLDGAPVQGVSVTLNPRNGSGTVAGGFTDSRGIFRVTTGAAPVGSGAKAGEYDVTFYKVKIEQSAKSYLVPQKYENAQTSNLDPIKVESGGKNSFSFALTSTESANPTSESDGIGDQKTIPSSGFK